MKFVIDNYTNNQNYRNKKYYLNIVASYLSKVNNGNTKARCEISAKLTIKT